MAKKGFTTPAGKLLYPRLFKPDTKFEKEFGVLKTDFLLPLAAAKPVIEYIETARKKAITDEKAERAKKNKAGKVKEADLPYTIHEEGELAGNVVFRFKRKAGWKDKETGEKQVAFLPVFGPDGKAFKANGVILGSGTIGQVAFEASPFFVPALGAGVSLRLLAVSIHEAKAYESDGASYGFDKIEPKDDAEEGAEEADEDEEAEEGDEDAAPAPSKAKANF